MRLDSAHRRSLRRGEHRFHIHLRCPGRPMQPVFERPQKRPGFRILAQTRKCFGYRNGA
jgi:hypothetical protein